MSTSAAAAQRYTPPVGNPSVTAAAMGNPVAIGASSAEDLTNMTPGEFLARQHLYSERKTNPQAGEDFKAFEKFPWDIDGKVGKTGPGLRSVPNADAIWSKNG